MTLLGAWFVASFFTSMACEVSSATATQGGETAAPLHDAWVEPGWGKEAFHPLAAGDEYPIVLGGQGAYMFTLPLRAGGFELPDPELHWTDPGMPTIDAWVDIPSWSGELDPRGHFSSVHNYPLSFRVIEDGSYEYVRVALLLPNDLTTFDELVGQSLTLGYELRCGDGQTLSATLPLTVSLSE